MENINQCRQAFSTILLQYCWCLSTEASLLTVISKRYDPSWQASVSTLLWTTCRWWRPCLRGEDGDTTTPAVSSRCDTRWMTWEGQWWTNRSIAMIDSLIVGNGFDGTRGCLPLLSFAGIYENRKDGHKMFDQWYSCLPTIKSNKKVWRQEEVYVPINNGKYLEITNHRNTNNER